MGHSRFFLEEVSPEEIAARLGLTVSTVKKLIHRAKKKLRAVLPLIPKFRKYFS